MNGTRIEVKNKKIIAVMAVWDEQNMIALSIESTKDIIYEYVVIIKKGIDKTRAVVEHCQKLWQLNVKIIESELKLREARKMAFKLTEAYADYYLIQDGDEIYFTTDELKKMGRSTILDLIEQDYDHCSTSMIFLKGDLCHTQTNLTWIIPHPFLVKNLPEVFWPNDKGDLPYIKYDWSKRKYKLFNTGEKKNPFKYDCNIKNFRRMFLRPSFTAWHDGNYNGTIEEFSYYNDSRCIYYRTNIQADLSDLPYSLDTLEKIIEYYNERESHLNYCVPYEAVNFYCVPAVIKKYIDIGLLRGIEDIQQLSYIK